MALKSKERQIIDRIIALTEAGGVVRFEEDMGEGSLTIFVDDDHTHCGYPDASRECLIDSIYATLVNGVGLSWSGSGETPCNS